jgi:hypothetical protein
LLTPNFDIDADIVWKTAVEEVPGLLPRLRELLEQAKKGRTSKIPLDRIPEPLRSEWASRANDGVVASGMQRLHLPMLTSQACRRFLL